VEGLWANKYSSTIVTYTIANSLLKTVELQDGTFKSKSFSRLWQVSNLGIGESLTSTSFYLVYCLTILKRQLPLEGKLLDSITMRSCRHCIADHMMKSYSDAFHTKRHRKPLGKLMTVCAKLTNLNLNLEIDSENLATTDQKCFLMMLPMLSSVMLSDPWWLHPLNTKTSSPNVFFMSIWDVGNRCHRTHRLYKIQNTLVHSSNNWLFFKMDRGYPPEGSKDVWRGQVHQASRLISLWYATMNHPG